MFSGGLADMSDVVSPVDAGFAAWLQADALYASVTDSTIAANYGTRGLTSELLSCLVFEADADTEATRQLAFLAGPLAQDEHIVKGLRHDLLGRLIRLTYDGLQALGYDGKGSLAFVIGCEESDTTDTTTLTVLKRLT
jgi:hypothetical protein